MDAEPTGFLGALGLLFPLAVPVIIQAQAPLQHLMLMALAVVAVNAEVVILKSKVRDTKINNLQCEKVCMHAVHLHKRIEFVKLDACT